MSALAYKRQLEQIAGLTQDTAGMSGADLAQAAMLAQANVPTPTVMPDGARLDQMDYRGAKDDFTGPDAALNGRYTKPNPNRVWQASAGFTVATNAAVYNGVGASLAVVDTGLLDNFAIRSKITAITANGPRFIVRAPSNVMAVSGDIYVERDQTANTWKLINQTGSVTISSFNDAVDLVANDVVECQVKGDNVAVFVNGTLRGTLTGLSAVGTVSGVLGFRGVAASGFTADDFFAYHLA